MPLAGNFKTALWMLFTVAVFSCASARETLADESFSSTKDWGGCSDSGHTYIKVADLFNLFTYSWTQTIKFNPAALSVTAATLALTHKGNSNVNNEWNLLGEVWVLSGGSGLKVGNLESSKDDWVTQSFDIKELFSNFTGGESVTIALKLSETTQWLDRLWLDKSVISGTYTTAAAPVPIPGTATLLGASLLGLIGLGSRAKS